MYKLLFIVIALFIIGYTIANCKVTEGFADTTVPITSANIDEYVYKVYKADVKAIQNLADIAMKLQAGGVTVPGTMTISNQLNVTNATLLSNTLEVKGAATLDSTLAVTGATTINGNITGPTITDLYKQITDLQAKCVALEARSVALEAKTSGISADGQNINIKGTATVAGITITNNGTQFGLGYNHQNDLRGDYTWNYSQFVYGGYNANGGGGSQILNPHS